MLVASNPVKVISICLTLCGLSAVGLINWQEENNALKLWVPTTSHFVKNNRWLEENFPQDTRYNNVIITGENVLTPEMIIMVRAKYLLFFVKILQYRKTT